MVGMVPNATVNRLVATSADFDLTGLQIIGYYLRLYAIELILGDEESTAAHMEVVTQLMKSVEDYKASVGSAEESQPEGSVYSLVYDQGKAKTYVLNFSMSLYNGKLKQIQTGPWDYTLQRGLWCCIDLFSCVLHLWQDEDGSLQRRIKYCKVYLTRLAKGQLGPAEKPEEAVQEVQEAAPVSTDSDDEINALLSRLRAAEDEPDSDTASIELPKAPVDEPSRGHEPVEEPQFVDSEEEPEKAPEPEPVASGKQHKFTQDQLHSMMEKSGQIEKVQKMAKYAISALNYDDIPTARDELTKALEILNSLE